MKLTKEDYMRLPKERLAEMLAELDNDSGGIREIGFHPNTAPAINPYTPWWREVRWDFQLSTADEDLDN